ncbi:putative winged helix-turn-helix DNA-binding domain, leucine-rich repeat domain, L [Lupinus albus]|uniref:Putative winged helix-turn-helix DNA-binding domain, leucine-rich repeat domain, L n=1 Tax=Lupinus albus TaxID=3870 RepID=A0A6A4QP26_LUPAL|nr:putative winged helix-turn-helix DNA-binding domain, leucine-rich repeat domain, L [Lupinus albus]
MDCINGFASSITRDLVCGAVDELRYPCCFTIFVADLQEEEDKFVETRNSVQERVDHANKQTKKTAGLVHHWLKQANTLIDNVDELLKKAKAKKSCCFGNCPNWVWRYRLGKQLAKSKMMVERCNIEGRDYTKIERLASLPGLGYFSSERCLRFDSRQFAYEQLMEALKGNDISMIGLYGMGGCGKTTLAIEVGKTAKEDELFHKVLFVAVSSTVEVLRIQEKIASWLEYDLKEKEEMQRAQRLFKRLTQEEKILVILDDVWQRLDFEAIGIPSNKKHQGCKVLVITRSEEVCIRMDCQRKIQLSTLTDEEAWALFQIQAHISEDTSGTLQHLARQISDECEGLPVALTAVASTLKGKHTEDEWKVALSRLKSSKRVNIEKGLQNPYKCLQLSYDNLDIEEAKSLFLLCSVFPEGYEIPVEDLTRLAIGLGVVGEVRSYRRARDEVSAAKNKLTSSSLLSDVDEGECVKMHDLVRNVALWIADHENKVIKCAPKREVTLDYTLLSYLWCEEFPNQFDCSNLEFLCINTYMELSGEIFNGMEKLRVLFLVNKALERRPLLIKSFKSLTNLRCLLLQDWKLDDISFVGDLKKLESLTLRDCSFIELPDVVVTHLTNLRLLDLLVSDMERNPFGVIGRHPQLEELYIFDGRSEWNGNFEMPADFFNNFSVPQALQRYQIQLGTLYTTYLANRINRHRILCLSCFDTSIASVKDLAKKADILYIANVQGGAKSIIPDIFQIEDGMNEVIEVLICHSAEIECLVDTSNHLSNKGTLFCKLLMLTIYSMKRLGALCHGMPPSGIFEKLEQLELNDCPELLGMLFFKNMNLCSLKVLLLNSCPKLTSLFTQAVARSLVNLEKLRIEGCDALKHIIVDGYRDEIISTDDKRLMFPKLKWLQVEACKKLEYILPLTFAHHLLQLECLEIERNDKLKYVFSQCTHGDQSQNDINIELPALEELKLSDIPNIISVFPRNCYPTWPLLRHFIVWNCPKFAIMSINSSIMAGSKEIRTLIPNNQIISQASHITLQNIKEVWVDNCELEGIFELAKQSIDGEQDPLTSCLQRLYLENLPQLRYICKGVIQSLNLQNLQQMEVIGCRKLKCIFSACIRGGLPQLKELMIRDCNQLEKVVEDEEFEEFPESTSTTTLVNYNSGAFNLCSLTRLTLESCPMLSSLFSTSTAKSLTSLEELRIEECHGLRYLVTDQRNNIIEGKHQSDVSMFPSLRRINIDNCNLLEYIFHASSAQNMVELRHIYIKHTSQLRYVFGQSIHDDIHSSHQDQNKIQIEFPVLEEIVLKNMPNMIGIWPENYYATCSSLQWLAVNDVGVSSLCINSLRVDSGATHSDHSSTSTDIGTMSMVNIGQMLGIVTIENSYKMKGIFHLEGLPITERQVVSRLNNLKLINLPELSYIWRGPKHFVRLQHLYKLHICGCPKLKVVFSVSVLRILPLLRILVVERCEELKQIIEYDEEKGNVSSPQVPEISFSQLTLLLVTHCNNLKCLFFTSTPLEFPELEYLVVNQDTNLVQVFECELGVRERKVEAMLPKLKHVILMQLPNLSDISQGIELQTLTNLLVHNCPKLSLTSTTGAEDMLRNYNPDKEIDSLVRSELRFISDIITRETATKDPMPETTSQFQMSPEDLAASKSEFRSSQVNSTNQSMPSNIAESVHEHKQTEREATQYESHEFIPSQRNSEGSQDLQLLEQKLSPISSQNLKRSDEETEAFIIEEIPVSVKPATIPTSGSELRRPTRTPSPTPLYKIPSRASMLITQIRKPTPTPLPAPPYTIPSRTSISISDRRRPTPTLLPTPPHKIASCNFMDQGSTSEAGVVEKHYALGGMSIDDIVKESIQDESTSEEAIKATLSTSEHSGVSSSDVAATHPESSANDILLKYSVVVQQDDMPNEGDTRASLHQKIQNDVNSIQNELIDGEIGIVCNGGSSNEAPPGASADAYRSNASILTELETFKQFVDLDDAHIAMLAEAIAIYPHLWNVCDNYSERFQAWRLKTLADMLLFLRNESAISVTPEREKTFHRLCSEAVQLGFERTWVNEMCKRVMVRDPRVGHAQAQLDELTQELAKIKVSFQLDRDREWDRNWDS